MAKITTNGIAPRFDRQACKSGLIWIAVCMLGAIAIFAFFPQIDIETSAYFGTKLVGFSLRTIPFWEAVRQVFIYITNGSILLLLGVWVALRLRPSWRKKHMDLCRIAGFSVMSYLLIPGVVVNGLVKPVWGRARPNGIVEFGGTLQFTSPLEISDQCAKACSFVSGETSALFTCAMLALLFVVPVLAKKWQRSAAGVILGLAIFGSLLRIAVGAHFVSDVVFSALLSSGLVLIFALRLPASDAGVNAERPLAPVKQA